MRATFAWSPSETMALLPSFRFVLGPFDVRMCRVFVWPRTILPVPVFLKRLAAPEWVFNLGIFFSFTWFWRSYSSPMQDRGFTRLFKLFRVYRNRRCRINAALSRPGHSPFTRLRYLRSRRAQPGEI